CDGSRRPGKRRRAHVVAARRRAPGPLRTPARHRDAAGAGGMRAPLVGSIPGVAPSAPFAAPPWVGQLGRPPASAPLLVRAGPVGRPAVAARPQPRLLVARTV